MGAHKTTKESVVVGVNIMIDKYRIAKSDTGVIYLEKNGMPTICTELSVFFSDKSAHTSPCMPLCPFFIQNDDGIILDCRTRQRFIKIEERENNA